MINVDFMLEGEDEPFTSTVFEDAPAVGDRVWIQEAPNTKGRTVIVKHRDWLAQLYRQAPNNLVILTVSDVPVPSVSTKED